MEDGRILRTIQLTEIEASIVVPSFNAVPELLNSKVMLEFTVGPLVGNGMNMNELMYIHQLKDWILQNTAYVYDSCVGRLFP